MDPQEEEEDFRASVDDPEVLYMHLDLDDAEHLAAELEDTKMYVRLLVSRARVQYGQETWISEQLMAMYNGIKAMEDHLEVMVNYDAFPIPRRKFG